MPFKNINVSTEKQKQKILRTGGKNAEQVIWQTEYQMIKQNMTVTETDSLKEINLAVHMF